MKIIECTYSRSKINFGGQQETTYKCQIVNCFVPWSWVTSKTTLTIRGAHEDASISTFQTNVDLNNVGELAFTDSKFQNFPKDFTPLKPFFQNLKHIDMSNCSLTDNDLDFYGLPQLVTLSLNDNQIKKLSNSFADFKKLRRLSVANNKISRIDETFLNELKSSGLDYIDLQKNVAYDLLYDSRSGDTMEEFIDAVRDSAIVHKSLTNANKYLWESGALSDFTIKVTGREFKVHKNILAANSVVFQKMFNHEMEENIKNEMEISDYNADVIEQFLMFIYMAKLPESETHVMDLFAVSAMHEVEELKIFCEKQICKNINDDNANEILALGNLHNSNRMKKVAFAYILKMLPGMNIDKLIDDPDSVTAVLTTKKAFDCVMSSEGKV